MRFQNYVEDKPIINENIFSNLISKVSNYSYNKLKKLFKKSWIAVADAIRTTGKEDQILAVINSKLNTNYRSLDKITNAKINESENLNEGWKQFWDVISAEGFFNLKFFPALQVWFELANILTTYLKGSPIDAANIKATIFYGLLWLGLASGKFIKDFFEWKKKDQDTYYAERPKLAKKHGYKFKDPEKSPFKKKAGFV